MLFLKYISDVWEEHHENFQRQYPDDPDRVARKMQYERFVIPPGADFYSIYEQRNADNLGEIIDMSLEAIERENKEKLDGVFRNISFNSEAALGKTAQRNAPEELSTTSSFQTQSRLRAWAT
jgi:type I restriction enzyme M protein